MRQFVRPKRQFRSLLLTTILMLAGLFITEAQPISWVQLTTLPPGTPERIFTGKKGFLFLSTYDLPSGRRLYRSTNNGISWDSATCDQQWNTLGVANKGSLLGNMSYRLSRSSDNGDTWSVGQGDGIAEYLSFTCDSIRTYAGSYRFGRGCIVSSDDGKTWSDFGRGLPYNISDHQTWYLIWSLLLKENFLFATAGNAIWRADTSVNSWTQTGWNGGEPRNLMLHPDGTIMGYVEDSGARVSSIIRSGDNGVSWDSTRFSDMEGPMVADPLGVLYHLRIYHYVWPPSQSGVFASYDKGRTWREVNDGLPPISELKGSMGLDANGILWIVVTEGVFHTAHSVTAIHGRPNEVPLSVGLEQNYPNPFNPSTTILYSLPKRSHVTLTVFNTLGQQVAMLVNGDIDAGYHTVQFDAAGLSSGVYFYRMQTGDFVQSRKLLLIR